MALHTATANPWRLRGESAGGGGEKKEGMNLFQMDGCSGLACGYSIWSTKNRLKTVTFNSQAHWRLRTDKENLLMTILQRLAATLHDILVLP